MRGAGKRSNGLGSFFGIWLWPVGYPIENTRSPLSLKKEAKNQGLLPAHLLVPHPALVFPAAGQGGILLLLLTSAAELSFTSGFPSSCLFLLQRDPPKKGLEPILITLPTTVG